MSEKFRELLRKYPGFFQHRFTFRVETTWAERRATNYERTLVGFVESGYVVFKSVESIEVDEIGVSVLPDDLPEFITDCVNYREGIR